MVLFQFMELYSKYLIIYVTLYFIGRAFLIIYSKIVRGDNFLNKNFFETRLSIFYPIIGIFFLGNLLNILNFIIPLKSMGIFLIIGIILTFNLFNIKIIETINIQNVMYYILIPWILIISSYGIDFHYDGGYYHLGHQLWLRESNLVIGFVNISWPYGISSIYEYISSILWIDSSFYSLHLLNIVFISTIYIFFAHHLIFNMSTLFHFPVFILLIFSILDNFGFGGGRNGYLYIEGVTAFDIPVAVTYYFFCLFMYIRIKEPKFSILEFIVTNSLFLLLIQLKLSSAIIVILYIFYLLKLYNLRLITISKGLLVLLPNIILYIGWTLKNYLTTGCLVFPLSISCVNNFSWYEKGSTQIYQEVTTDYSNSYKFSENFYLWIQDFLNIEINKIVLYNFLLSLIIIHLSSKFIFIKKSNKNNIVYYFLILNILFLIFFGPLPRYAIGLIIFSISLYGFGIKEIRFKLHRSVYFIVFFISISLVPRLSSYKNISTFPLIMQPTIPLLIDKNDLWTTPVPGEDQCWTVQYCTPEKDFLVNISDGFFKSAIIDK